MNISYYSRKLAQYMTILFIIFGLTFLASWGLSKYTPRDDSDPPGGRSGLRIYTDNMTGLQYLSGGKLGALTPRLNTDGTQVRVSPVKPYYGPDHDE